MPIHIPLPDAFAEHPFAVKDALDGGVRRGRLRGADLARPFHGVRVALKPERGPGPAAGSEDDTDLAAVLSTCQAYAPRLRTDEMFYGETAALLWQAQLPHRRARSHIHVAVCPPHNASREKGVMGHRIQPRQGLIATRHGLPLTDPATTWLTLASILGLPDLVAVGDYFAHVPPPGHPVDGRPFLTLEQLRSRVTRFHGRGKRRASEALELICTGAESRPESLLRLLLGEARLPTPQVNPEIQDARGDVIGRADLVYRPWKVIVEYDGDQHRTDTYQYEKDMTRLERFHRDRWTVLRVRKHGLFRAPHATVGRVDSALRRAGWSSP
ncbi:hypothetical protein BH09ACT6_BH09ACT6_19780 [soil metagenome]